MTTSRFALVCAAILATGAACASPPRLDGDAAPAVDRERITPEEWGTRPFYSAYDVVASLRPNWLNLRGQETEVQVYVDENHLGGIEALRRLRLGSVRLIRHMDGISAAARYGRGHDSGAILVTTISGR